MPVNVELENNFHFLNKNVILLTPCQRNKNFVDPEKSKRCSRFLFW